MYKSISIFNNLLKIISFEGLELSEILLKELYEFVVEKGIDPVSIIQEGDIR